MNLLDKLSAIEVFIIRVGIVIGVLLFVVGAVFHGWEELMAQIFHR